MDLISLVLTLALVGFVLWLVVTYVPMPEPYRKAVIVLVVIVLVVWLIRALGIGGLVVPIR